MSCDSATGPVDIKSTKNTCSLKCYYSYNYSTGTVNATNKSHYISIKLLDSNNPVVKFSSSKGADTCNKNNVGGDYVVKEVRMYVPSLHKYNGNSADGELFIYHTNITGGSDLLVCIPISRTHGTQENATLQLESIISEMRNTGNRMGEQSTVKGLKFNLNDFIPKKGFYTYSATLPYYPCNGCITYIVYDKSDASIYLSNSVLKDIKNMIEKTFVDVNKITNRIGYSYNKAGGSQHGANADDIYIDCSPTGDDGEILIEEQKADYIKGISPYLNNAANLIQIGSFIKLCIIILVIYITYRIGRFIYRKSVGEQTTLKRDLSKVTKSIVPPQIQAQLASQANPSGSTGAGMKFKKSR